MSSLRRDLIERRLWPVVVLLVMALVAVPTVLLKGSSNGGAPPAAPPPPAAAGAGSSAASPTTGAAATKANRTVAAAAPPKVVLAKLARDPFASGTKLASAATTSTTTGTSATASSGTGSASASTAVSSSPSSSGSGTSSSTQPSTAAASSSSTTTTSAGSSRAPVSTTASVSPTTVTKAKPQTWLTYAVSLRFGKNVSVPLRSDIARLTPLPSVRAPEVMYIGVTGHGNGSQAAFALRGGLQHSGPGICRPDHTRCTVLLLKPGQTEQITVTSAGGVKTKQVLRVVRITSTVTHSSKVAKAAYDRHSAAGLCELILAEPMYYNPTSGTLVNLAGVACENQPAAVPFSNEFVAP